VRAAALFAKLAMSPHAARALRPALRRWPWLLTAAAILGGKVRSRAIKSRFGGRSEAARSAEAGVLR
jgi:hypothetical protein